MSMRGPGGLAEMSEGFTVSKGSQWGGLGSPGLQGDYMPPPRWCSGLAGTSCSCHSTPCDALPSPSALRPADCSFAKRVLQTFPLFPHFFIPLKTEISLWLGAVALCVDFLIQKVLLLFFNGTEEWFLKVVHCVVCSLFF